MRGLKSVNCLVVAVQINESATSFLSFPKGKCSDQEENQQNWQSANEPSCMVIELNS